MKAVLFGSIGTIVDSSQLQLDAFNAAFRKAGLDWQWTRDAYRQMLLVPGGNRRIVDYARALGQDVDEAEAKRIHELKTELFDEELLKGRVTARPGVLRLLQEARDATCAIGFITTTDRHNVTATLEAAARDLKIEDFDIVTCRDTVRQPKPHPAVWIHALDQLGMSPEDVIAIEDTAVCMQTAVDAGLNVVAIPNNFASQGSFQGALARFDHLGDPDVPATQFSGVPVLEQGCVTIDSLQTLLSAQSREQVSVSSV